MHDNKARGKSYHSALHILKWKFKHLWNPWFSLNKNQSSLKTFAVHYKKTSEIKNILLEIETLIWSGKLYKIKNFWSCFLNILDSEIIWWVSYQKSIVWPYHLWSWTRISSLASYQLGDSGQLVRQCLFLFFKMMSFDNQLRLCSA